MYIVRFRYTPDLDASVAPDNSNIISEGDALPLRLVQPALPSHIADQGVHFVSREQEYSGSWDGWWVACRAGLVKLLRLRLWDCVVEVHDLD